MKSLAEFFDAIRYAIRSHIIQREVLIIYFGNYLSSVIYRRIKGQQHFIAANIPGGREREGKGRVIITQIDRLPEKKRATTLIRASLYIRKFKFLI